MPAARGKPAPRPRPKTATAAPAGPAGPGHPADHDPPSTAAEPAGRWRARAPAPHRGPVLVDSGPLIALFNGRDHWHAPVLAWLQANPDARLCSTWPVATEVCALLARRVAHEAALDFLRWAQRGGLALDTPVDATVTEVLRLSERFASLPFDLADASIAEAAGRRRIRHVLSIDADFEVYRDRAGKALVNLLAG